MSSEPTHVVKPDDITPEEHRAAGIMLTRDGDHCWAVLVAQNALRDQRIHAELLAEIQTLRQALWDAGTIIGMDTDGNTTPDHSVNLVESILYLTREAAEAARHPKAGHLCPRCLGNRLVAVPSGTTMWCSSCGGTGHTPTKEKP